jgi:CarD family transcriptional regulator, regulator of rRNA transcription
MAELKVGDKVVYPNHGLAIVENINKRDLGERNTQFYQLRICSNNSLIMIPTEGLGTVGLRKIINDKEVNKLYRILQNGLVDEYDNWMGRYRENLEKMQSGSIFKVAEVLKNLFLLSNKKDLSYREKKMFTKARYLIISELMEVQELPEVDIEKKLDRALSKCMKKRK